MGRRGRQQAERAEAAARAEAEAKAYAEARARLLQRVRTFVLGTLVGGTVLGTVIGLYVVDWFVALLPGPTVQVIRIPPTIGSGAEQGCTLYTMTLVTHGAVDDVYFEAQFPGLIQSYVVGRPATTRRTRSGHEGGAALVLRRDEKGRCAVLHSPNFIGTGIQTSVADHTLTIQAAGLAPDTFIGLYVATAEGKGRVRPPPPLYMEGTYEYVRLRQIVRKSLDTREATEQPPPFPLLYP